MRKSIMLVLAATVLAMPVHAQEAQTNPEDSVDPALAIVFRAQGPAWWKATRGDSTVWIMGLPATRTPAGMKWDQTMLKRRLKGARLMLAPFTEWSGFDPNDDTVVPPLLPPGLAGQVREQALRLGDSARNYKAPTVASAFRLRYLYYSRYRLTYEAQDQIYDAARAADVRIVVPPIRRHYWDPATVSPEDPEIAACIEGIVEDVQVPRQVTVDAARLWAEGDVPAMLKVTPNGVSWTCRRFWPGHWERTIDFQTKAIAQALETPGKVIAVVHTRHLVAQDGVLSRLRAQGYTIADPKERLPD